MADEELDARLSRLERRLDRVERLLNVEPTGPVVTRAPIIPSSPKEPAKTAGPEEIPPTQMPAAPPSVKPPPLPLIIPMDYAAAPPASPVTDAPAAPASKHSRSLEQTLGLKWTGWIGALVLLVGMALGVRFVYEQHWMAAVPNWVLLALMMAGGLAVIGFGEWAYCRVHKIPAASLFAVGIATLFLSSYVGYAYYNIYSPGTAFVLMAISTVIGAVVARRGNMVSIGVLSLLGGNITPLVLHNDHPNLNGFLAYLGMLEAVALILAYVGKERKWSVLRGLSLLSTSAWIEMIATGSLGIIPAATVLAASVAYAVGYEVETIASRLRGRIEANSAASFVFLVTLALTVGGLLILRDGSTPPRVWFVGAEAVATAALAMALRRPAKVLATSFAFQTAALVTLLIPVAFSGEAVFEGWAILAVAMALMGARPGMLAARAMAPLVWFLAAANLLFRLNDAGANSSIHAHWLSVAGTPLEAGLVLGWILVLAGELVAWLTIGEDANQNSSWSKAAWAISLAAMLLWVGLSTDMLPALGATTAILALAWVFALADCATTRLRFAGQAIVLLCIAAVKWAAVDGLAQRLSPQWSAMEHRPLANAFVALGTLVAISFPAVYWLRRESILALMKTKSASLSFAAICCAIGVLTFGMSLQIDLVIQQAVQNGTNLPWPAWQLENLALTLLWSAAVGAVWLAALWSERSHAVRWLGIFLVLKFVTVDTSVWFGYQASARIGINLLAVAALAVTAVVLGMSIIQRSPRFAVLSPGSGAVTLALITIAWAACFEVHRWTNLPGAAAGWDREQLQALLCAAIGAGAAQLHYGLTPNLRDEPGQLKTYRVGAAIVLIIFAFCYLTIDTLFFRLFSGSARAWVLFNPQVFTAAVIGTGLALVWRTHRQPVPGEGLRGLAGFLIMPVALWTGTLEIDRYFQNWSPIVSMIDRNLALQVAISIFWGVFAIGTVAIGLRLRAATMRYFGLGLFAVTLLKIVVVDLGQVSTGYRVLSFMGLGAMLIGTSILYGKLSPRLLGVDVGSRDS